MDYKFSNRVSGLHPSAIREILKFTSQPDIISFAAGNPAPDAFPVDDIRRISAEIFDTNPIGALQYSISEGYPKLRDYLRDYLKNGYNIGADFDDIIITSGANQIMEISAKVLCNEGDTVICESPTFIGSLNAFRSYGLNLAGVDIESDGMDIGELEKALENNKNARFIYTIPNFQNPSGVTMSMEKRKAVYALAKKYNVLILEDNPYGDTRFAGEDIPCIKTLDTDGIVIYAGSLSKVVAPGIRVGFIVAPSQITSKMTVCKQVSDVHTNIWAQMVAFEYMSKCDFAGHLADIRAIYKRKAELMMNLLDKHLVPLGVTYHKAQGGLFLWCTLPDGVNMPQFCKTAVENKVAVVPGNAFLMDESLPCQNIRLNFSTPTDEQMIKGMQILEDVLKSMK